MKRLVPLARRRRRLDRWPSCRVPGGAARVTNESSAALGSRPRLLDLF